jgi:DNA mismatch repair protein MutL
MDPSDLDVNIHPAKVEIGLHSAELVYSTVISTVKKLLLSFDSQTFGLNTANVLSPECQNLDVKSNFINFTEKIVSNNPYPRQTTIDFTRNSNSNASIEFIKKTNNDNQSSASNDYRKLQIVPYIITTTNTFDLLIVHQNRAQERIFFEQYMNKNYNNVPQQLLFPIDIQLSPGEYNIIQTNKSVMNSIGFNIDFKSQNIITICGHPSHLCEENIDETIHEIIEQLELGFTVDLQKQIAVIMSKRFKHNMIFSNAEMDVIINQLFNCKENIYTVDDKKIWTIIAFEKLFN